MKAIALLFLFWMAPAFAKNEDADILFPRLLEENYFSHLRQSSIENFAGFHLPTLIREAQTVTYRWNNRGFVSGSGGQRTGGVHLVKNRLAVMNSLSWIRTQAAERPRLALHETLGALGYDDEDYQLTFALDSLANQHKAGGQLPIRFQVHASRSAKEKVYAARGDGGSTLVGGGGSECEIYVKGVVVDSFINNPYLSQLAINAKVICDPVDSGGIIVDGNRIQPFKLRWRKGRIEIRTSMLVELAAPHLPWIREFIAEEFRAFASKR